MSARTIPQARSRFDLTTVLMILGIVLTAAQSAIILVFFLSGKITTVDNLGSDTRTLKADVAALEVKMTAQSVATKVEVVQRMDQMQLSNEKQFSMIRSDTGGIPSAIERVNQLERRVDRDERTLEAVQAMTIETAATLKSALQKSAGEQRISR